MGIKTRRGRSEVVFEAPTNGESASGELTPSWAEHARRRCTLDENAAGETTDGNTIRRASSATISVRFVTGLTSAMRAQLDGRTWQIESVINVENMGREQIVELRELV
jgi:head-tail adaptor